MMAFIPILFGSNKLHFTVRKMSLGWDVGLGGGTQGQLQGEKLQSFVSEYFP